MADIVKAVYVRHGDTISYKAEEDIAYRQVVPLESCIGIADSAMQKGDVGGLTIAGAYRLPTKGEVKLGQRVYWDKTMNAATATAGANIPCGIALEAQKADGNLLVRLGYGF